MTKDKEERRLPRLGNQKGALWFTQVLEPSEEMWYFITGSSALK